MQHCRTWLPALMLVTIASSAVAQARERGAFSPTTSATRYPIQRLARAVYAVLGDTGRGVEGRPNAGFVDTKAGVVVVGGVASPAQGDALVRTIRTVTKRPISWLVLYAHHPDMQFGAISLRHAGAKVIAHPDANVLAAEGGPDQMVADWDAVVGLQEMLGFEYANVPDHPVTGTDTLLLGGDRLVLWHPGPAHSPGDLMLWLPEERILFAGDVLVGDGVPMVVDGSSTQMLATLDAIEALSPRVIIPGHGPIPADPRWLLDSTRHYFIALRRDMKDAVERGVPMKRALAMLPPADETRPVSLNSRRRRNANRVYVEMEREVMGLDEVGPRLLSTDSLAAWQAAGRTVHLLDVRRDVWTYLKDHLPSAQYLNIETLRAGRDGVPMQPLNTAWYRGLFGRLGLDPDVPVVAYSAGESLNIDATFAVWILASMGHRRVYLLDGGYFKWQLEGRELAHPYPRLAESGSRWTGLEFKPALATLDEVRRGMGTGSLLVDARPLAQYVGEEGAQMRRGHIPGAISHYWQDDLVTQGFGRVFQPVETLRATYRGEGITPDRDIILYCNSATEASHLFFVLRYLLDYPKVRIFAGSWTEWAERTDLPIETGMERPTPSGSSQGPRGAVGRRSLGSTIP